MKGQRVPGDKLLRFVFLSSKIISSKITISKTCTVMLAEWSAPIYYEANPPFIRFFENGHSYQLRFMPRTLPVSLGQVTSGRLQLLCNTVTHFFLKIPELLQYLYNDTTARDFSQYRGVCHCAQGRKSNCRKQEEKQRMTIIPWSMIHTAGLVKLLKL